MTKDPCIEIAVLNIVAHPHDENTYLQLLGRMANHPVRFRGREYAAITNPELASEETGGPIFGGRIVVWTEIDSSEPAIRKDRLEEVSLKDLNLSLDRNIGFNARTFLYAFRKKDHKLFFEAKNEFGKRLTPSTAVRIFEQLSILFFAEFPDVSITAIPEDHTVERILGLPKLRRLEIHLLRPNPDDLTDIAAQILEELEGQGAARQDTVLIAKPGEEGLTPNERTRILAQVAASNGSVTATGRDEENDRIELSTEQFPKITRRSTAIYASVFATLLSVAKEVFFDEGAPPDA